MPFCPNCRFEYLSHVKACPDCGAALVARLPEEAEAPPYAQGPGYEQALLGVAEGEVHAQLVQSALQEAGIPSRQQPGGGDELIDTFAHTRRLFPTGLSTTRPVRIWVNARDLERAREVWRAFGPQTG